MVKRQALEADDKTLWNLNCCLEEKLLFQVEISNKFFQFFQGTTNEETIDASIAMSRLWEIFENFELTENMRARDDPEFAEFLKNQ